MVTYALRSYAIGNDWLKPFEVQGFTSAYLPVNDDDNAALFYANPYVYGRERYHFAMVTFTDDDNMQNTCPARILSFVRFSTSGFPTPGVAGNQSNECLYAVVHTSTEYLSFDQLDRKFIAPFALGDIKKCVYIINADAISNCLFVFRNYGHDGTKYFCTLCLHSCMLLMLPDDECWASFFTAALQSDGKCASLPIRSFLTKSNGRLATKELLHSNVGFWKNDIIGPSSNCGFLMTTSRTLHDIEYPRPFLLS
jgi:hypothetical protein